MRCNFSIVAFSSVQYICLLTFPFLLMLKALFSLSGVLLFSLSPRVSSVCPCFAPGRCSNFQSIRTLSVRNAVEKRNNFLVPLRSLSLSASLFCDVLHKVAYAQNLSDTTSRMIIGVTNECQNMFKK